MVSGPVATIADVALAIGAWHLGAAQSYDELLSLSSLRGVEFHA
jgi:hypothetical protein